MNRSSVVGALLSGCLAAGASQAGDEGAALFASRCSVCHGAQAAGVPGYFPSLHEQVIDFARTEAGRDYLVMVVTTGLAGQLEIAGVKYNNVMPAQSGLSEADVAAVLNYLASDLGKNQLAGSALTAELVKAARTRHPENSNQTTRALRPGG